MDIEVGKKENMHINDDVELFLFLFSYFDMVMGYYSRR